jgi:hypothetical protein
MIPRALLRNVLKESINRIQNEFAKKRKCKSVIDLYLITMKIKHITKRFIKCEEPSHGSSFFNLIFQTFTAPSIIPDVSYI